MDILIIAHFITDLSNSRFTYIADLLSSNSSVEIVTSDFNHVTKKKKEKVTGDYPYKLTMLHESGYKKNVCLKRFKSHKQFGKNVAKYLKTRKKADVIFCAVPSLDCAYYAAKYAKKFGVKFIIDVQDLWPEAFKMVFNVPVVSDLIFAPMMRKADFIYSSADEIVGVSQTYCNRAQKVNNKVVTTYPVFLGTDLDVFDTNVEKYKVVKESSKFVLGYCGTLGHSYDLTCVFDALKLVKNKTNNEIEFRIFGDGPLKSDFEKYAKSSGVNAVFYGRLPYGEMCAQISACDVAINPISKGSRASIINKHADYAAAGIPIINTQESDEYRNLIEKYNCGINCACANSEEMAYALLRLINEEELRIAMGKQSRVMAVDLFNKKTTYKIITSLILNEENSIKSF